MWRVERDVIGRETACVVDSGSTYDEDGVRCVERYTGRVSVDTRTFEQRAVASATFGLAWPEATVSARAELDFVATAAAYEIDLRLVCRDGDDVFAERHWRQTIPRDLG